MALHEKESCLLSERTANLRYKEVVSQLEREVVELRSVQK